MIAEASLLTRQLCAIALCLPAIIAGVYYLRETILLRRWTGRGKASIVSFETKGGWILHREAAIRYTYTVAARAYEGSRITVSDYVFATGPVLVERQRRRYPVGTETTVFYDQNRPERSVLRRPRYWLAALTLAFGFGVAVFLVWDIANGGRMPPGWHPHIHIHVR